MRDQAENLPSRQGVSCFGGGKGTILEECSLGHWAERLDFLEGKVAGSHGYGTSAGGPRRDPAV